MGVPAGFSADELAAHRFIARNEIFHYFGQNMAGMWHAVGGRRAFEEYERFRALAFFHRFIEDAVLFPEFKYIELALGFELRVNLVKHFEVLPFRLF